MSSFFSENGMEILLGAAFIVFAMSASRFIAATVREKKNSLSAGSVSSSAKRPEKKGKKK